MNQTISKKIYGIISMPKEKKEYIASSLFDEIEIEKVEKKKVQIVLQGKYSKGIPNNEENEIFKAISLFFSNTS